MIGLEERGAKPFVGGARHDRSAVRPVFRRHGGPQADCVQQAEQRQSVVTHVYASSEKKQRRFTCERYGAAVGLLATAGRHGAFPDANGGARHQAGGAASAATETGRPVKYTVPERQAMCPPSASRFTSTR